MFFDAHLLQNKPFVCVDATTPPQVDKDKDGKISWSEVLDIFEGPEEVEQQYMEAFAECDKDDDLQISREELPTFFDKIHAILQAEDKKMGTGTTGLEDL